MANDPHTAAARAAMAQDQEDVTSRDQIAWELQVRSSEANASQTEAMAHAIRARGDIQQALANAIVSAHGILTLAVAYRVVRGAWRAVR
jgi:hypothetical protein